MWNPVSHSILHGRPAPWTPEGAAPLQKRLQRYAKHLPDELRGRVQTALSDADDLLGPGSGPDAMRGTLQARYECMRSVERLIYEAEQCPLPDVGWQRPGWVLAIRLVEPVRIRFALRRRLVARIFARQDAVGRRTEERCDWFWDRCGSHGAAGAHDAELPKRSGSSDWGVYELVKEEPD